MLSCVYGGGAGYRTRVLSTLNHLQHYLYYTKKQPESKQKIDTEV